MEKNQIHQLLAKYFEGKSTLEEERILLGIFSDLQDSDPEWRPVKKQFELFRAGREYSYSTDDLEANIIKGIEEYELRMSPPVKKRSISQYMVAASIAIAVVLSGIVLFRATDKEIKDTFNDPQLAYAETQKALLFVSQKMNQGMKPLTNISKINSGSEQLKNLEKMDKSLGMLNLVSFINQSSNLKK